MNRTDPDVVEWLNALPDDVRVRLFEVLGLIRPGGLAAEAEAERLAMARMLSSLARTDKPN